jgi:hypothetical protein
MRASDYPCPFFGRSAENFHHPTGPDAQGEYLDPLLKLPVSLPVHGTEHAGWRLAGIGEGSERSANVLRLRRLAHIFRRLGEHHGRGVVALPAPFLCQLAAVLLEIATDIEADL